MEIARSDAVLFRRMTETDLDFVMAIERAAAAKRFVSQWTRAEHQRALGEPGRLHLIIEAIPDNQCVGFILLAAVDSADRNIEFQRIVVQPEGQGHGRQAIRLLKRYVFNELGARRLWLDVEAFNERARTLYRSEGFVEEGNGPADCAPLVIMSILKQQHESA